jgi:hypothetical protein
MSFKYFTVETETCYSIVNDWWITKTFDNTTAFLIKSPDDYLCRKYDDKVKKKTPGRTSKTGGGLSVPNKCATIMPSSPDECGDENVEQVLKITPGVTYSWVVVDGTWKSPPNCAVESDVGVYVAKSVTSIGGGVILFYLSPVLVICACWTSTQQM